MPNRIELMIKYDHANSLWSVTAKDIAGPLHDEHGIITVVSLDQREAMRECRYRARAVAKSGCTFEVVNL